MENPMVRFPPISCTALTLALTLAASIPLRAAETDFKSLNPQAISIRLPTGIDWKESTGGVDTATLVGDESKPGLYVMLVKWKAHHNSHPHYHPNDRFITVLSGTWWVNTGRDYEPGAMRPVAAGSFVTHYKNQVHYDGARDGDVILEIVGMGPATAVAAEEP
jgi:quercetin dioxygenase-like cupin family protein